MGNSNKNFAPIKLKENEEKDCWKMFEGLEIKEETEELESKEISSLLMESINLFKEHKISDLIKHLIEKGEIIEDAKEIGNFLFIHSDLLNKTNLRDYILKYDNTAILTSFISNMKMKDRSIFACFREFVYLVKKKLPSFLLY